MGPSTADMTAQGRKQNGAGHNSTDVSAVWPFLAPVGRTIVAETAMADTKEWRSSAHICFHAASGFFSSG